MRQWTHRQREEIALRYLGIGGLVRCADMGIYPRYGEEQEDLGECATGGADSYINGVQDNVVWGIVRSNGQHGHSYQGQDAVEEL